MSKHRKTRHRRKIVIAALAVGAVGVPSVAMACFGDQGDERVRSHDRGQHGSHQRWQHESPDGRQHDRSQHHRSRHGEGHAKPTAKATETPTATPTKAPSKAPTATPTKTATKVPTKAPAPAPSATRTAAPASSSATARVVELVNIERSKVGCSPLKVNAQLTKAAQDHSKDMAAHRNMSHTGSDGSSPEDRIQRAGYNWSTYGENVAYGYSTPESVMKGWMSSPGHKRNILDCSFKEIGVGLAQPGYYWTQDFGTAG
ncbi:CAP domain-containing protein [Streptomyces sp. BP-8]|uniref:CAP domain-containing protein n=1 Tax=Streptomyces sirii TaxID=3127701 RepID=A0ABZ2QXM2_9ACTN